MDIVNSFKNVLQDIVKLELIKEKQKKKKRAGFKAYCAINLGF